MRVLKYLRGHIPAVALIVLLLVAQSFCELSLPAYTSRIVDTGIQSGGIEYAAPLALTDKTMDGVRLFLPDDDAAAVSAAYTDADGVWTINDTAQLPELEGIFIRPLVMYARLSEQGANTVLALRQQMQGGLITHEEILARGEEALSGMGTLTDSVLHSAAVQFLKTEYAVAGLNVNHIRNSYLLRTGGKMLLLTLGMIAAAVLCNFVGAQMSAAIGRDLRAQVFRKVLSFSSAEMDKFSTASLITRTTNDVTQIQAVCVLIVRVVLYAPVIGLGGIIMVARTKTGLGWIIALAVAAMLLLVGVLMKIAMPQFRTMQQRVDDVNLVSREVLTGLPVIRAFHRERHEEERFDTASVALMKTQLFVNRTMAFMGPVMTLIMYGVTVMIEWFGAKSINAGNMQIGDMIAFSTYASLIIMAFMMITIVAVLLPRAEVSATRVDEILRTRASVRDPRSPEPAPADATVTFDHVSFRYPGAEDDVLHDISFTARPGEVTAIVGSTGCGKSTLLNLIPRFYDATGGTVSIRRRERVPPAPDRPARHARLRAAKGRALHGRHSLEPRVWRRRLGGRRHPRRRHGAGRGLHLVAAGTTSLRRWRREGRTCPAGSGSACPSRAPLPSIRRCTCLTTAFPRSTIRRMPRCVRRWPNRRTTLRSSSWRSA